MVISKASPQLQNILDLKGQDRSSSKKDEGTSFAKTLKNKSKDSPASSRDFKSKQQDKKETYQDLAGGDPLNASQSPVSNVEAKMAKGSRASEEVPGAHDSSDLQAKNLAQSLPSQTERATTFGTPVLESSELTAEIMDAGLSQVATSDSEELAQMNDLTNLDTVDGDALKNSEDLTLGLENDEVLSSPLSTSSSDVDNKTLENHGLENKSSLSDIMKGMELLENPEVLDNVQSNQKMTTSFQDKAFGNVNLRENLKGQENLQATQLDPAIATEASTTEALIPNVSAMSSGLAFGQGSSEFNQDMAKDSSEFTSNFAPVDQQNPVDFAKPLAAATTNVIGDTAPESKIENMSSIIREARAIVDDGGGSMEIHLQPEGLGKVQLKVAVHEGRINVEMMTDNPAAKKALEEGLFEVRNALEGQKLLVETLKVEMGQNVQKDFTDMRDHMQEQKNRDFAQDFLEQFRQGRENRFGGLIDRFRNSPAPMGDSELKLTRRNPYAESGKGRTLNLVA